MTEAGDPEKFGAEKFDPRFDSRFQPGYRGDSRGSERDVVRPETGELRAPQGDETQPEEPQPPVSAPSRNGEAVTDSERAKTERAETGPAETGPAETERGIADEVEPNPFERTLWVVALVLVVGGVAAALWANSFNYESAINAWGWQQIIRVTAWSLTTPMITVGLATGVGLLFRRAITWKPDR